MFMGFDCSLAPGFAQVFGFRYCCWQLLQLLLVLLYSSPMFSQTSISAAELLTSSGIGSRSFHEGSGLDRTNPVKSGAYFVSLGGLGKHRRMCAVLWLLCPFKSFHWIQISYLGRTKMAAGSEAAVKVYISSISMNKEVSIVSELIFQFFAWIGL